MIAVLLDIASWILMLAGVGFVIIGTLGLVRLPDVYSRMHATGITDTTGAGLILVSLALQAGLTLVTAKLFLIVIFLLYTTPTSTYALANAAFSRGLQPIEGNRRAPEKRAGAPE